MRSLSYDLHIHSCLSPCGDDDMTPANIAGMCALIGLDVIAVTDHNTCKNCPAVLAAAKNYGLLAIPGMELCTSEEVHVLCLFENLEGAMDFDRYVENRLIRMPNNEEIFGHQYIYDCDDHICGSYPWLLINATDISFDDVFELTGKYGGIMIPAHIDKDSTSLLSNLGFIPPDSRFTCAEVKNASMTETLQSKHPYLEHCRIITNSDAHDLGHIHEAVYRLHASEKNIPDILKSLTLR